MARRVGVPPHPPTCPHRLLVQRLYLISLLILWNSANSLSLPLPSSLGLFFSYFLLHPLKAKRLFFPSFWRWYNFTWSLYNAHSQPPPLTHTSSSIHPHPLLFRFWLDEAILWIQHRTHFFFCFLLHPLFFLAKKILRTVNFGAKSRK